MKNTFRNILAASAFAAVCITGLTTAKADVVRVAVVVADNQADFANNAALIPSFEAMLQKGKGIKAVYAGTDAAKFSIMTTSVWANEADIASVSATDEWKATAAKLKYKSYAPEVFQSVP